MQDFFSTKKIILNLDSKNLLNRAVIMLPNTNEKSPKKADVQLFYGIINLVKKEVLYV